MQGGDGIAHSWDRLSMHVGVIIPILHVSHWRLREVKLLA